WWTPKLGASGLASAGPGAGSVVIPKSRFASYSGSFLRNGAPSLRVPRRPPSGRDAARLPGLRARGGTGQTIGTAPSPWKTSGTQGLEELQERLVHALRRV